MRAAARALGLLALATLAGACRRGTPTAGGIGDPGASDTDASTTTDQTYIDGGSLDPDAVSDAASEADVTVDAGDAGALPDPDAAPDAPYASPPVCPDVLSLGAGSAQPISTHLGDVGLSVTPDQLSAAWLTISQTDEVTLHWVDRASVTDAFGAAKTMQGAFAPDRVALTPDGLGVAVTNDDRLGFSILRRAQRGDDFGAPEVGPFSLLNAQGQDVLAAAGERYADPLFAASGAYFVFSRYGAGSAATVYLGSRIFPTDPYSPGTPYGGGALAPAGDKRRVMTGASVDMRTLFVWDQATLTSQAVRVGPTGAIEGSADLGARRDLQPSAACDAFWFTADQPGRIYRTP
jgi:hypothetical protein